MRVQLTSLWRNSDFLKMWTSQTVSLLGSQITLLALPLTAALSFNATPVQMGILGAVEYIPFILVALFAGVWIDRMKRRPILIAADLGRAVLLAIIPIIAFMGWLRIEHLYIIGFLTGVLTTFFAVAYQSYFPTLVSRDQLVEGNSKLELSRSITEVTGPGLAGFLVQVLGGPFAILLDISSFLLSATMLGTVRKPEATPPRQEQHRSMWSEIAEGLRVVLANPLLRSIAACSAISNLFTYVIAAVFVLYVTRELNLSPSMYGLILAVGSIGAVLSAMFAEPITRRFGVGQTIVGAQLLLGIGSVLISLAAGPVLVAIPLLVLAQFLIGFAQTMYNINQISLRQEITPERLQGRMNASMRFIVWGAIPIGSLLGGALGSAIGLRPTLLVGGIGVLLAFIWVALSPLRRTLATTQA